MKLDEVRRLWDDAAEAFDEEADHGLRDPIVREAWVNLLVESLPVAPAAVLDIGCGTGSLSLVLAELGYTVTGVDLSGEMLARAKVKLGAAGYDIPFSVMDASHPNFAPRQFDVILCRHVLWALPDAALALQRWSELLVVGGRLVLVEGYWHTGGGLHAEEVTAALPPEFSSVMVKILSGQAELWGGEVEDERYVVIAR